MVKYIIDEDEVWKLVEKYEHYIEKIKGYRKGDQFFIVEFKSEERLKVIWVGRSMEELKLQLKTERAKYAIRSVFEELKKPARAQPQRARKTRRV